MVTWRSFMKCLPCKRVRCSSKASVDLVNGGRSYGSMVGEQLPEKPCYALITGQAATSLDHGGSLQSTKSRREEGAGGPTMESTAPPARCEIARLPEDLLSETLARTTPRDACRAAAVSPAFHAAADADAVWSSFLPRDLPPLADGEVPAAGPQPTKKQLFMRLSDSARPLVLADGLTSMWLDRATGAKCYTLSPRKLRIVWGDTSRRLPHPREPNFDEVDY